MSASDGSAPSSEWHTGMGGGVMSRDSGAVPHRVWRFMSGSKAPGGHGGTQWIKEMKIKIRHMTQALLAWEAAGSNPSQLAAGPETWHIQAGDFLTHPDFPERWLLVLARHIDLAESALTLFVDLLPESQSEWPDNVQPLFPAR